jgi:hypothetical protein
MDGVTIPSFLVQARLLRTEISVYGHRRSNFGAVRPAVGGCLRDLVSRSLLMCTEISGRPQKLCLKLDWDGCISGRCTARVESPADNEPSLHPSNLTATVGPHLDYKAELVLPPQDTPIEVPAAALDMRSYPPSFSVSSAQFGPR